MKFIVAIQLIIDHCLHKDWVINEPAFSPFPFFVLLSLSLSFSLLSLVSVSIHSLLYPCLYLACLSNFSTYTLLCVSQHLKHTHTYLPHYSTQIQALATHVPYTSASFCCWEYNSCGQKQFTHMCTAIIFQSPYLIVLPFDVAALSA